MNHMFSASKQVHSGIQSSPASTKSASSQQAKAAVPKARKVLPITEPSPTTSKAQKVLPITESRKAQAATSTQTGIQSQSRLSRNVAGHQNGEKPRKHALLIVDPDSKAQVLPPAPKPSMAEPRVAAISMTQNAPRSSKHLLSIVDPTNKQSVQLVHSSPATDKPAAPNARAVSRPAIKRALQIIDPQNKEAVTVPAQLDQLSGSQLSRTVSSTSAASSDHGRTGKRPVAITDPHHKQPVQLPVRADSLGRNHLLRTVSSTSAASTDSNRPGKRALAIVDPYNKEHVRLPAPSFKSAIPSSSAQRKALTIVDPHNKQPVLLPGSTGSELGGVQTESRSELELHSLS